MREATIDKDNASVPAELSILGEFLRGKNYAQAVASRKRLDRMLIDLPEAFNYSLQALFSLYEMELDNELGSLGSPEEMRPVEETGQDSRDKFSTKGDCVEKKEGNRKRRKSSIDTTTDEFPNKIVNPSYDNRIELGFEMLGFAEDDPDT